MQECIHIKYVAVPPVESWCQKMHFEPTRGNPAFGNSPHGECTPACPNMGLSKLSFFFFFFSLPLFLRFQSKRLQEWSEAGKWLV